MLASRGLQAHLCQDGVSHAAAVEGAYALLVHIAQHAGAVDVQVGVHDGQRQARVQQVNGDPRQLHLDHGHVGHLHRVQLCDVLHLLCICCT